MWIISKLYIIIILRFIICYIKTFVESRDGTYAKIKQEIDMNILPNMDTRIAIRKNTWGSNRNIYIVKNNDIIFHE